jgi:putative NADH-flavin reductase
LARKDEALARITVLGGTGYAGGAVVAEAARRGHDTTSVSRGEPQSRQDGVTYLIGSVLDDDVLADAVTGRDVVVEAVSPRGDMAGKEEGLVQRLIELCTTGDVRLGVIGGASSLLVSDGGPRLIDVTDPPPEVRPEIETGLRLLEMMKAAPEALDWFFVSPPEEFGAWAPAPHTGTYRLSDDVLLRDATGKSTISAADLAVAILDEIEQPEHRRRRLHAAH